MISVLKYRELLSNNVDNVKIHRAMIAIKVHLFAVLHFMILKCILNFLGLAFV